MQGLRDELRLSELMIHQIHSILPKCPSGGIDMEHTRQIVSFLRRNWPIRQSPGGARISMSSQIETQMEFLIEQWNKSPIYQMTLANSAEDGPDASALGTFISTLLCVAGSADMCKYWFFGTYYCMLKGTTGLRG